MQYTRRVSLMLAVLVAVFLVATIAVNAADNDPVTVTAILQAAKCPLTSEQQAAIKAINPDEGTRGVRTVTQTFTDDQNTALIAKLGEMAMPAGMGGGMGGGAPAGDQAAGAGGGMGGGRGMMGPRINYLTQVIVLEKEGVPLTEKQLADAKKATEAAAAEADQGGGMGMGGMGGFGRGLGVLADILTEKQTAAYEKYTANMGGGMGGGGFGGGGFGN